MGIDPEQRPAIAPGDQLGTRILLQRLVAHPRGPALPLALEILHIHEQTARAPIGNP